MNCENVVVIDFETTGFSSQSDRVIEVGAIALEGNRLTGEFSRLMNPGDFVPYNITQLTGINDEMLAEQPRPEDIMPELADFIGERTIIAHNASFDSKFLQAEMERVNLFLDNPVLCTLKLARRLMPGLPSYSLSSLKNHLSITSKKAHRALDDAKATAFLWRHLLEQALALGDPKKVDLELLTKAMSVPASKLPQLFR